MIAVVEKPTLRAGNAVSRRVLRRERSANGGREDGKGYGSDPKNTFWESVAPVRKADDLA